MQFKVKLLPTGTYVVEIKKWLLWYTQSGVFKTEAAAFEEIKKYTDRLQAEKDRLKEIERKKKAAETYVCPIIKG